MVVARLHTANADARSGSQQRYLTPTELLSAALTFHGPYNPFPSPSAPRYTPHASDLRPDNPFLVSYAAYHHYRALGWVVKTGIKFCVDWLLYKRGLVFTHAEWVASSEPGLSRRARRADAQRPGTDSRSSSSRSGRAMRTRRRVRLQCRIASP